MPRMPMFDYIILAAGLLAWVTPFFLLKRNKAAPSQRDRRARWGLMLQVIAYVIIWQGKFWVQPPAVWRVGLSALFLACAAAFSWTALRALGKQWRLDAGLNADHELVRHGVYAVVRHPIYTSMLCLLLGQGFMVAPWPLLATGTVLMILGTEIRVRCEERLLRAQFGAELDAYRQKVGAYVPWLKLGI